MKYLFFIMFGLTSLGYSNQTEVHRVKPVCCHCCGKGRWPSYTINPDGGFTTTVTLCPTCGGSGYGSCESTDPHCSGNGDGTGGGGGSNLQHYLDSLASEVDRKTAENLRRANNGYKPRVKKYRYVACQDYIRCQHPIQCQHPIPCSHFLNKNSALLGHIKLHDNDGFYHINDGFYHNNDGTLHKYDIQEYWE